MKNLYFILSCCFIFSATGQNIDINGISKAEIFTVNGGITANGIYNTSSSNSSTRDPFTYILNGNLNFNFFSFSVPLTYTLTNQGNNLDYSVPFKFNRLSISPKYKWITAHIGDATMNFSPYTLNGHPFTGAGVELTPNGPVKFSAMAGRLLKAVEVDQNPYTMAAYKRMGYGAKIELEQEKYKIGLISFYAKDDIHSLSVPLDEKNILPKENLVTSLNFSTNAITDVTINFEYAYSALTEDTRAKTTGTNLPKFLFTSKESTVFYSALKTSFDLQLSATKIGLGYEKVDPGYTTLGALYMTNDFENITVNITQPFYQDKIILSGNIGYQRDNLNNAKKENTKRVVGSVNLNYKVTDQLDFTANYSNFSTFTNKKLNQFDEINTIIENPADTLNYRQLSQNAGINANYSFGKKDTKQNINYNYNISGSANEQGGVIRRGQANMVQNHNLSHTIRFEQTKLSLSTSLNYTLNEIGVINNTSSGGGITASKKLFSDQLSLSVGGLYNETSGQGKKLSVINGQLGMNYIFLKKHNFNLNASQMFQKIDDNPQTINDLTINFGYNYNF